MNQSNVTVFVVLHDGRQRLSWKIVRGSYSVGALASRYYCGFSEDECQVIKQVYRSFSEAEEWVRGFQRHALAQGQEP